MPKLITTVFANNGDKAFPAASSTDGTVNLDQGYTPQYEIDLLSGDPTAKAVERNIMNGMFNWLFDNQMFDQSHGIAPWFSTFTGGYPLNALVADNTAGTWQIYRSLIEGNSSVPTLATAWERILTQTEMLNRIPFAVGGASGSSAGELASATNLNSVTYSQGVWLVTTDAIAASLVNAPSARQGVLICRNTNKNYNPTLANVGSFFQMYIDADGKQYIRSYAIPSGGSTAVWTAWRTTAFLNSPAFTGTPTAPTADPGTSTTQIASTEFVGLALLAKQGTLLKIRRFDAGTTSITMTSGAKNALWILQGGGGGGGGCPATGTSQQACAGGGYSGAYAEIWAPVSVSSYVCSVGAAGTRGAIGASGGTGGDTSVTGIGTAAGGGGGGRGVATSGSSLTVTARGSSSNYPTATSPGLLLKGLNSVQGDPLIALGSGASQAKGGDGGDSPFGRGGSGGVITTGADAIGNGSGGGGASQAASFNGALGGLGTPGVIILMEFS